MEEDFGDFTGFGQAPSNSVESNNAAVPNTGKMINNVSQVFKDNGVTNFPPLDVSFDIQPPISPPPANVHLAGGIPFDIPPLPDDLSFDDFSPIMEIQDPFNTVSSVFPSSSYAKTTAGNETSIQTVVQPVADNSIPPIDIEWSANFGHFSIPPPIDTGVESSGDFIETPSESNSQVKLDAVVPEIKSEVSLNKSLELEKPLADKKEVAMPSTNSTETFSDFSAFSTHSTSAITPATGDFSTFAAFESVPVVQDILPESKKEKEDDFGDFTSLQNNSQVSTSEKFSFANFGSLEVPPFPAFEDTTSISEPPPITNLNDNSFEPAKSDKVFGNFNSAQSKDNSSAIVSGKITLCLIYVMTVCLFVFWCFIQF